MFVLIPTYPPFGEEESKEKQGGGSSNHLNVSEKSTVCE